MYKRQRKIKQVRDSKKLRRSIVSKDKRRKRNATRQFISQYERRARSRSITNKLNYNTVVAPKNLSFVDNTVSVIKFIDKLRHYYNEQKPVFVVLRDVEVMSYDALVVLLSIMVRFKASKIGFNGDVPKNTAAKNILLQSRFLELLYFEYTDRRNYYLGKGSSLHTHASKDVDPELGASIIKEASKTIWKEERRCQGVQRSFVELMQNTNNHADIGREGEKHWWLSVFHIPKEKKVTFAFIDFGVGVFTSLDNKPHESKFYQVKEKLSKLFTFQNNADMLRLILAGELHKTATGKYYRGKGLPGLKDALERKQISNLCVITNNVRADVNDDNYDLLNCNFGGTFIYWELNSTNVSCRG